MVLKLSQALHHSHFIDGQERHSHNDHSPSALQASDGSVVYAQPSQNDSRCVIV